MEISTAVLRASDRHHGEHHRWHCHHDFGGNARVSKSNRQPPPQQRRGSQSFLEWPGPATGSNEGNRTCTRSERRQDKTVSRETRGPLVSLSRLPPKAHMGSVCIGRLRQIASPLR